ncbi:MAG: DUF1549 domain-containing protein, partial [Bacteroidota bacterium]
MPSTVLRLTVTTGLLMLLFSCGGNLPEDVQLAYAELPAAVDFNFHVRPILSDRCFHCHGPDEAARQADLRLDREDDLFKVMDSLSGKQLVVAGKPLESDLIERILHTDPEVVMPPGNSDLSLSSREKAILVKWIEQGAGWKKHWAFTPPVKAPLPKVARMELIENEIDHFVLARLDQLNLVPAPRAQKRALIRRVTLDLTGLPPTPEEVVAFVNDATPTAYEALVDRLLASPAYGERWAWEWLDVARYSDTNGYQADFTRTVWPWRDWVIRAFNANMPYDEFSIKQLAG